MHPSLRFLSASGFYEFLTSERGKCRVQSSKPWKLVDLSRLLCHETNWQLRQYYTRWTRRPYIGIYRPIPALKHGCQRKESDPAVRYIQMNLPEYRPPDWTQLSRYKFTQLTIRDTFYAALTLHGGTHAAGMLIVFPSSAHCKLSSNVQQGIDIRNLHVGLQPINIHELGSQMSNKEAYLLPIYTPVLITVYFRELKQRVRKVYKWWRRFSPRSDFETLTINHVLGCFKAQRWKLASEVVFVPETRCEGLKVWLAGNTTRRVSTDPPVLDGQRHPLTLKGGWRQRYRRRLATCAPRDHVTCLLRPSITWFCYALVDTLWSQWRAQMLDIGSYRGFTKFWKKRDRMSFCERFSRGTSVRNSAHIRPLPYTQQGNLSPERPH